MKLFRLCIAIFAFLAMIGSSQACVILGQHLGEVSCAEKCGAEDDESCAGCATPMAVLDPASELGAFKAQESLPPAVDEAATLIANWRSEFTDEIPTHPPPDPLIANRVALSAARALPARGPDCLT